VTLTVPGPLPWPPRTPPPADCSVLARRNEGADGIERGHEAVRAERMENLPGFGREAVRLRARAAQRGRGR